MSTVAVDGVELFYREQGSGSPVLLIHGTAGNADLWSEVFDALAVDRRVSAYDRRGCSRSPSQLAAISCPVTCLVGTLSQPFYLAASQRITQLIPQAKLQLVAGAGHCITFDQPAALVGVLANRSIDYTL